MEPVRVSLLQAEILRQLSTGTKYGRQIVRDSNGTIQGQTVYVYLRRMEDRDLIVSVERPAPAGESGPPRRWYEITDVGRRCLEAHRAWVERFGS